MKRIRFFTLLMALCACAPKGPKSLPTDRVRTDILQDAYVKNCMRQGFVLSETEVLKQTPTQSGLEVLTALHFTGKETPQTIALLCEPVSTVRVHYAYQESQAVFKRLSLELSRSQLNRLREKKK
jgi:predicted small lipoprotein YifL